MAREPGFYWVKFEGRWQVAEYTEYRSFFNPLNFSYGWDIVSSDREFKDDDFEEIDERKINREA